MKGSTAMATLINFNDKQAMFNTVVSGIAAQDWRRSVAGEGNNICKYRGRGTDKCALGHLIKDEDYETRFDEGIASTHEMLRDDFGIDNYEERVWLIELQNAHDGTGEYNYHMEHNNTMQKRLIKFAKWAKLAIPEQLTAE